MDIQLYYEEKGSGEPLILLHGNGEDHTYFIHQIEYFKRNYRVIAIDTRGHGRSLRGDSPFTIRQFVKDLYEFMAERGIGQANILGFSDGGNIALVFAIHYPEKVKRLILNGANLNAGGVKRTVQIPIEIGYRIAGLFAKRNPKAKRKAEMLGLMVNDPDIEISELKKVRIPVLVIAGEKDMIKKKHSRQIYENLPFAQLAIIPGDHFIANKEFKRFNKEVEQFLI